MSLAFPLQRRPSERIGPGVRSSAFVGQITTKRATPVPVQNRSRYNLRARRLHNPLPRIASSRGIVVGPFPLVTLARGLSDALNALRGGEPAS
jgi:hypothetical protein